MIVETVVRVITLVIVRLGFGKSHDKEFRRRSLLYKAGGSFLLSPQINSVS
jgi:hypothetical protein